MKRILVFMVVAILAKACVPLLRLSNGLCMVLVRLFAPLHLILGSGPVLEFCLSILPGRFLRVLVMSCLTLAVLWFLRLMLLAFGSLAWSCMVRLLGRRIHKLKLLPIACYIKWWIAFSAPVGPGSWRAIGIMTWTLLRPLVV